MVVSKFGISFCLGGPPIFRAQLAVRFREGRFHAPLLSFGELIGSLGIGINLDDQTLGRERVFLCWTSVCPFLGSVKIRYNPWPVKSKERLLLDVAALQVWDKNPVTAAESPGWLVVGSLVPIWKICAVVKLDHETPRIGVKMTTILELPPPRPGVYF